VAEPRLDFQKAKKTLTEAGVQPVSPLGNIHNAFSKWLLIKDPDVILVVIASVVANRLEGDPFWLFLVSCPSGLKTELISSLSGLPEIHPLSDLTAQTFASGMKAKGPDPSLLPKLKYGTILTLKDFTTVLCMHRDRRQEILSQLREIYDGSYSKSWGTGKTLNWEGKLGLVAGVTTIIDTHYSIYQTLGERFIQYRIAQPDPEEVSLIAMRNQGREKVMRQQLRQAVSDFANLIDLSQSIELSAETLKKLAALASFVAMARSGVVRDQRGNKDLEYVPEPEAPPRLAKQLAVFMKAAMLCGLTESKAYNLAQKLGFDSIHRTRFAIIHLLQSEKVFKATITTKWVAEHTRYPTNTIRRYLEDLTALGVLSMTKTVPGKADLWRLSSRSLQLLINADTAAFFEGVPQVS
jgi:hypothetical protein